MTGLENLTEGQMAFLLAGAKEHEESLREIRDRNARRLGVIPLPVLRERLAKVDPEKKVDPETELEKRAGWGDR